MDQNHPIASAPIDFRDMLTSIGAECAADPLMASRYATLLRRYAPDLASRIVSDHFKLRTVTAMPAPASITAAQITIFDNWQHTRGKRPKRGQPGAQDYGPYRARFDFWTVDPDAEKITSANTAFSASVPLLSTKELLRQVATLENPKRTKRPFVQQGTYDEEGAELAAYASYLRDEVAPALDPASRRAGPVMIETDARFYPANTFAVVDAEALAMRDGVKIIIASPAGDFEFSGFEATDARGNPLKGNAILNARSTRSTRLAAAWRASVLS